ncbi:MAG: YigZ family protein [Clostridiales bacterium]|nr:YigZ family protein [Clostridiales bacterium]
MAEGYKTVKNAGSDEIVVKKSRFIANVFPVSSEEEAAERVLEIKKKYHDARHSCYAYRIGKKGEWVKYSDDGEPQGTAGIPILDILKGEDITDVLVVVTRYFGGILLGTGGLVRAYSGAAKAGLAAAGTVEMTLCRRAEISADYSLHGKIQYMLLNRGHKILDTVFTDKVKITAACLAEEIQALEADVRDISQGRAVFKAGEEFYT